MAKVPSFSEGLNAGIKIGLLFLAGFLLLGQSGILSLILATLGGVSTAWLVTGWYDTTTPSFPEERKAKIESKNKTVQAEKKLQKQKKERRQRLYSLFFGKKTRSSKSRRS